MFCVFVLSVGVLFVQEEKWDGGFFLGGVIYVGDFYGFSFFDFFEINIVFGFMLCCNISNIFGVCLGLIIGKLSGMDLDMDDVE